MFFVLEYWMDWDVKVMMYAAHGVIGIQFPIGLIDN
jgi:hypothetical protein